VSPSSLLEDITMKLISSKANALLFALALAALPVGMTPRASAGTISTFDIAPTSIFEGGASTLHLHLDLIADVGAIDADFVSGSVTLFSGQGPLGAPSMTFALGPSGLIRDGGTTRDFFATFTYSTAGAFLLSFQGSGFYDDVFPDGSRFRAPTSFSGSAELNVAATAIPAALPLFGTGLGLMGLVGWWRKRREAVA